jgi:DMSO/TMAO reductase YedYZ molybdopterin-dependent catalytic subunit
MGGPRRTNLALLLLLAVAFFSGWAAFMLSGQPARATLVLHGAAGVGIVLLVPWKAALSVRSIARRRGRSLWWPSVVLAVGIGVSIVFGVVHSAGRPYLGAGLSALEFHIGAALCVIPFAVWHLLARRVRPRQTDLSRRGFLAGSTLATASLAGYFLLPSAARAATGSFAIASPAPTSWMFDAVPSLTAERWRLEIGGRRWSLDELAALATTVTAHLDCTGGWWADAQWRGVWLARLLPSPPAGGSWWVRSATGYTRRFPGGEPLLLAFEMNGATLPMGNGFPARLVAPRRRGYEWVKWVVAAGADQVPAWFQPPFPLQ